jgi:YegS/Rv2252/BmrU family lipid kinase
MKTKKELEKIITKEKSAVLVVNTHSRKGRRLFFQALDELAKRGINIIASYPVHHPERLPAIMKEALRHQGSLVIVGGGDGTISSIVDRFAYQDLVLGILPLGTGNSFARTLGIPLTLEGAVDVIVGGRVADIDLGKIGDDYFANMAAIGFSADVAHGSSNKLKKFLGPLAYLIVAAGHFFHHRSFSCTFHTAHEEQTVKTHQVLIANGSFMGETFLTPAVNPDDGRLIVFTMDMLNRWQMLNLWIAFLMGKYTAFSEAKYFRTQEIRIETDPPQHIDVDGEKATKTPVTVSVAREALKVLVPRSFQDMDE